MGGTWYRTGMTVDPPPAETEPRSAQTASAPVRYFLIAFGWFNVAVGAVGIVVPGLPTTPFLLVAAWAFSRSSPRFQHWLRNHRRLGPPVRDWQDHRAIPVKAKVLAVAMMSASLAYIVFFVANDWVLPTVVGLIMLGAGTYVVTRPSRPR